MGAMCFIENLCIMVMESCTYDVLSFTSYSHELRGLVMVTYWSHMRSFINVYVT